MIISIEGNIGSGKSTLLNLLREKYSINKNIIFVDEPVSEWNKIKDGDKSILELFYSDKDKYSFTFQILAYITRLRKLLQVLENSNENNIIICERSIYTDKYVFAKMLYQQGFIKEIEWQTYNYWFDTFRQQTLPDTIIYVKTDPIICSNRIRKRNRNGEDLIAIEYLNHCHEIHEEWLRDNINNIITIDGNIELEKNNENDYLKNISMINL
jgi:deoxyadenosine/deoxycytidine kinase